jgi:predicted GNAT superfamily acetyltransferase
MRFANEYGYCELNPFPGCSQIVVSNHAFIYPNHRGKGKGRSNHKLRVERATFMGYDYLMCTVRADNTKELLILGKNGFKELDTFVNTNTGNRVKIFGKSLIREENYEGT